MPPKIKFYMFNGSAPSMTAKLMLEHKGLDHKNVHVLVGPHAFAMLGRGFNTMTVPALKINGRRIQGSREISRALDELIAQPPLFPSDPASRRAIEDAERWGESFQDAARRLVLCACRLAPHTFSSIYRHPNPIMRPIQRVARGLVIRLATAAHRATDLAAQEDLAALPACLDKIDALIEDGLLDGPQLNAADFQIAANVSLLQRFDDLAPLIDGRPAARLAHRVAPNFPGDIGAVLPPQWVTPIDDARSQTAPRAGSMSPGDVLRAIGYDEQRIAATLRQPHG